MLLVSLAAEDSAELRCRVSSMKCGCVPGYSGWYAWICTWIWTWIFHQRDISPQGTVRTGKNETGNGLQSSASRCSSCRSSGRSLPGSNIKSLSDFWTFEPKSASNNWISLVLNVFLTMSMQSELNQGNNKATKLVLDWTHTQSLQHPLLAATTECCRGKNYDDSSLVSLCPFLVSFPKTKLFFYKSLMKGKELK